MSKKIVEVEKQPTTYTLTLDERSVVNLYYILDAAGEDYALKEMIARKIEDDRAEEAVGLRNFLWGLIDEKIEE